MEKRRYVGATTVIIEGLGRVKPGDIVEVSYRVLHDLPDLFEEVPGKRPQRHKRPPIQFGPLSVEEITELVKETSQPDNPGGEKINGD